MGKKYEQYRQEIYSLDNLINSVTDIDRKLQLIDQDIRLNQEYIHALKKPIPVKIVFCVILSLIYLIGLMIFLPQIIVRKNKIAACERRIAYLRRLRLEILREQKEKAS